MVGIENFWQVGRVIKSIYPSGHAVLRRYLVYSEEART